MSKPRAIPASLGCHQISHVTSAEATVGVSLSLTLYGAVLPALVTTMVTKPATGPGKLGWYKLARAAEGYEPGTGRTLIRLICMGRPSSGAGEQQRVELAILRRQALAPAEMSEIKPGLRLPTNVGHGGLVSRDSGRA